MIFHSDISTESQMVNSLPIPVKHKLQTIQLSCVAASIQLYAKLALHISFARSLLVSFFSVAYDQL